MKNLLPLFFLFIFLFENANAQVVLQQFANGFDRPCDISHCGDDRLFVVEQRGYIWILDKNGNKFISPFLNIDPIVGFTGNERGLLGLAFHPDYPQTPYFYVNYTNNSGNTRVSRFSVSATNPNQADPNSEVNLFEVSQPYSNHNGGCLKFGPDGYLYIGLGDGGSANDPQANGQKRTTFLGKLLRIDVDNGTPYGIPPSNPFINDANTLDEIWAIGMRNPWRFSFDRLTNDLWIGDVGQDSWEEIDFQPAGSPGGQNYGWRCYEGNHSFNTGGCPNMSEITFPVAEYANSGALGCSVTGGFVYRGFYYPQLYGQYLYTDYCTGKLWSLSPDGAGGWTNVQIADFINNQLASFGENKNGELFALGNSNGIVYRVVDNAENWIYTINAQYPTCAGSAEGSIQLVFPSNVPTPTITWEDGSTGSSRTDLPEGTYTATITGANGSVATETVVIAPTVSLDIQVSDVTCPGGEDGAISLTVLGTQGSPVVLWSDGATELERTGLSTGSYAVTVTSFEGCVLTANFNLSPLLTSPMPVIEASNDTLTVGGTYADYQWFLSGAAIVGATDSTYVVTEEGTYSLFVSDVFGCTGTSNELFVEYTATSAIPALKSVLVTPNPFQQSIRLEVTVSEPVLLHVSITDMQGKTILADKMAVMTAGAKEFDLGQIPSGTYLLVLKNGKGEWLEKLVKM